MGEREHQLHCIMAGFGNTEEKEDNGGHTEEICGF